MGLCAAALKVAESVEGAEFVKVMRFWVLERAAAACVLLAAFGGCAPKIDGEAVYENDDCRRVALVDADTGRDVVGAEDLAFDAATGRVLISAYDRRTVESQAKARAFDLDEGGVYAARLADLRGAQGSLTLASIVERKSVAGGLRPHGLSFDPARREVTFVNRSYQKIDGDWRMTPRIELAGADGAVFIGDGGALRCSANDVAKIGDKAVVSFDHAACGWRGFLEDAFARKESGVAAADGTVLFDGAGHANGVAATSATEVVLAATRDRKLIVLAAGGERFAVTNEIALPGAPDNLTVARDGAIVAALHPSLLGIGLERRLGVGRSGSRIVRVDPRSGDTTLLFDDPQGALFSAATAAIEEEGILVAGSVAESGLLVCVRGE